MPPVVLFELEGVLADTAGARRDALCRSLAEEQPTLAPSDLAEACAGRDVRGAVVEALRCVGAERDAVAVDLLVLRAERHFAERLSGGFSLLPGARELLEALAGRATLGIVARATRREVDFMLRLAGLEPHFACVVSAEDASEGKPSPVPYRFALARLARRGLAITTAVAVEDGLEGIRSATGAGLPCIAVGALPAHAAMEAEGIVASVAELTVDGLEAIASRMRARVG